MEIKHYPKHKEKGSCKLARYGQSFQMQVRQFDQHTGEETAPIVQTISREEIQRQRDELAAQLAGADALLADMDALK